jgi:two-component system, sensor histidine kinase and response regulator
MSRILLAEDEPALLDMYCEVVAALGHECIAAHDGEEALLLVQRERPDLVITDNMMPGKTGLEVARRLRSDAALSGIPVILMSAGRLPERERREAWRFLEKPISLEQLEGAVFDALRAGRPEGTGSRPPVEDRTNDPSLAMAREEMLSWVAHEIKSPLSAAFGAAQLALRGVRNGEPAVAQEKRLLMISRRLTRMDELVRSLLDAAQLQDGRLNLDLETVDVDGLVEKAVEFWRDLQPDVDILLENGQVVEVAGDRERLRQILDNLISNAIKYGRPANVVQVRVAIQEQTVAISVTDHGRGIPRNELANIFDRFHRVAGQGGRGHGLGLFIAAALTRLHGGRIDVESEAQRGSTFTVTLPRKS